MIVKLKNPIINCTTYRPHLHASKQNHPIKNQWFIPVHLPGVWSLALKVTKFNLISMNFKKHIVYSQMGGRSYLTLN